MKNIDKISKGYDRFAIYAMKSVTTFILPVGLMIIGYNTTNWMWYYLSALIIKIIGEYIEETAQ